MIRIIYSSIDDIVYSPNKYRETEGIKVNHANAILALGWKDGEVYIRNEIYVYEKDTNEIIQLAEGKISKSDLMWADSAEPDRIKMWITAGYAARGVRKPPGSVKAQIDWLQGRKIHIHPSCVNTIKEIQQWKWQKDPKTNTYIDTPVAINDDAMAALRYGVELWRYGSSFSFD